MSDADAALAAKDWQPIETAPKDGNEFLALVLDEHHIMVWDLDELDWFEANSQSIIGVPTHWMPHRRISANHHGLVFGISRRRPLHRGIRRAECANEPQRRTD